MTYYVYLIEWANSNPEIKTVQVTGNFDNWLKTNAPLVSEEGTFKGEIRVERKQKLVFKFVVNGAEWVTSGSYKKELDENGIENNYIDADEFTKVDEFEKGVEDTKGVPGDATGSIGNVGKSQNANENQNEDEVKDAGDLGHIKDYGDALTATSSFAAISTNDSTNDSKYEHIDDVVEASLPEVANLETETNRGMDDNDDANEYQFNTPTNSVFNSDVLSTPTDKKNKEAVLTSADTTGSNINPRLPNASISATQTFTQLETPANDKLTGHKDEMVEILKVPGSFPSPTSSETNSRVSYFENKPSVKRETLLSRFKGLFKS